MEMIRRRHKHARPAAALVTAVILLLVMATVSATILSMHTAGAGIHTDAVRRLRADAAAISGFHLAAWELAHRAELQAGAAAVLREEGDTWQAGSEPLFRVSGELEGATFTVDVWPRPDEFRLHARAVCQGVHRDRWSRLPLTQTTGEPSDESLGPPGLQLGPPQNRGEGR